MMVSHLDPFTFILVDRKPVQHPNDDEWFLWYLRIEENRRVAKTEMMVNDRHVIVSTVFTSLDITPERGKLFETKVYGGEHDQEEFRCATWEQAEQQHRDVVKLIETESNE